MKIPKELAIKMGEEVGLSPEKIIEFTEVVKLTIQAYSTLSIKLGQVPTLNGLQELVEDISATLQGK